MKFRFKKKYRKQKKHVYQREQMRHNFDLKKKKGMETKKKYRHVSKRSRTTILS